MVLLLAVNLVGIVSMLALIRFDNQQNREMK
jgi:hypothetical protein